MRSVLWTRMGRLVTTLSARLSGKVENSVEPGVLCLSVSELGWQSTLVLPDEPDHTSAETWADSMVPVTAAEAIRRAVRALPRSQRDRIGSVRLLLADPSACIIDNRSARIRSVDPAVIAEAGRQELGVSAALYGFIPFGGSSEHEVERGVYAFLGLDRVRECLIALETLAVRLVEVIPATLLELSNAEARAFASLEVRGDATTLLLADPETGHVLSREIACGRNTFAAALADATSVSAREAAEGLRRRVCFQPSAGASSAGVPMTATERALTKILASLKAELADSMEYFLHHRLATAPERLIVKGEAERVRGLSEWLGHAVGLPTRSGVEQHGYFVSKPVAPALNLLQTAPRGLLTIGKNEYRFVEGRFRADQVQSMRPKRAAGAGPARFSPAVALSIVRERLTIAPAAVALLFVACLYMTASSFKTELEQSDTALASALAEDGVIRGALLQRSHQARHPADIKLEWFDKLNSVAAALPPGVMLTRVSSSGADGATDDRILLEGESAVTDDNLAGVRAFMDRLSADAEFMGNVGAVTFGGAGMTDNHERDLLSFSVGVSLAKPSPPVLASGPRELQ